MLLKLLRGRCFFLCLLFSTFFFTPTIDKEPEKFAAGKAEGEQKARIGLIRNLMETMGWTEDAAMDALKIPEDEREACRALLNE